MTSTNGSILKQIEEALIKKGHSGYELQLTDPTSVGYRKDLGPPPNNPSITITKDGITMGTSLNKKPEQIVEDLINEIKKTSTIRE